MSVAVAVSVCEPSAVEYPLTKHDLMPETASVAVQVGAVGTSPK